MFVKKGVAINGGLPDAACGQYRVVSLSGSREPVVDIARIPFCPSSGRLLLEDVKIAQENPRLPAVDQDASNHTFLINEQQAHWVMYYHHDQERDASRASGWYRVCSIGGFSEPFSWQQVLFFTIL